MTFNRNLFRAGIGLFLVSPLALVAQDLEHAPATESIRESDLRREVAVLTSDGMDSVAGACSRS